MRPISVLLLLALVGAVAFYVGRSSAPQSKRAPVERAEHRAADPEYRTENERLVRALDAKREELAAAHDRIATLEREASAEEAAEPAKAEPAPDAHAPRFVYEDQAKVLQEVDWQVVGEATLHLQPLLGKFMDAVREGRDLTQMAEELGAVQRWNGPLLTQAVKMRNSGLTGTYTNGAFTHPSIVVNQVYATLREAGQPLTENQEQLLSELGTRYIEAEKRRVAQYDESTFQAKKTLDEALLKEELYAEIDRMVTDAQRDALHPAAVRGVLKADFFSSGMIWLQVAKPQRFSDRADLVEKLVPDIIRGERIAPAQADAVRKVVAEWAAGLPDVYLQKPFTPEISRAFMKVSDVIDAARHCLDLRERLVRGIPDESARKNLRTGGGVIVPYRQAE